MIETHGSLETQVLEGEMSIPYRLQLVSKQVDLKCDGILGRDILKGMRARICYREQVLMFQYEGILVRKKLTFLTGSRTRGTQGRKSKETNPPSQNWNDSTGTGFRRTASTRGRNRESWAIARGVHGREPGEGRKWVHYY